MTAAAWIALATPFACAALAAALSAWAGLADRLEAEAEARDPRGDRRWEECRSR